MPARNLVPVQPLGWCDQWPCMCHCCRIRATTVIHAQVLRWDCDVITCAPTYAPCAKNPGSRRAAQAQAGRLGHSHGDRGGGIFGQRVRQPRWSIAALIEAHARSIHIQYGIGNSGGVRDAQGLPTDRRR